LDAYAETEEAAKACLALIAEAAPALNAHYDALEDRDWVTLSLEGLPPVEAGPFIVAGSHALAESAPGKIDVLIEAGPAFGTGHHGTTLGCLLALQTLRRRSPIGKVLDLGTGSGVLAIAALKIGASRAIGTDIDRDSVRVAAENAAKNKTAARFKALQAMGTRHRIVLADAPFQTVFANILARPLVRLAPDIARVTARGGAIVLSGLLRHQESQVRRAFAGRGLSLQKRYHRDGWSTLLFTKPL
ncbi:MAG: 50S ribosomal protein L11 methyltransferase, partial [Pseudomonadota bacterium]